MPTNDLEVFEELISDEGTQLEIDYLTYAIYAYRRMRWSDRFVETHGNAPTQQDIDAWITSLSDHEFERMRDEAIDTFHAAAVRYMTEDLQKAKEQGSQESFAASAIEIKDQMRSVITLVRNVGSIRSQLIAALVTAIATPIILGGTILFLKTYDQNMPSALRIFSDDHSTNRLTSSPPTPTPPDKPTKN